MANTTIQEYKEYTKKVGNRKNLYKVVVEEYEIQSAVYPGSHIDITPSLLIPKVTYIDNFKGAIKFFKNKNDIENYLEENKKYSTSCEIDFIGQDYREDLNLKKVDLIISQYAGFVGQDTKEYLKKGGILLCNDSHGDATLAYEDPDYEFIGIIQSGNKIQKSKLRNYFKLPKDREIDIKKVKAEMKGPKYKKKAQNYFFQKVK